MTQSLENAEKMRNSEKEELHLQAEEVKDEKSHDNLC